MENFQGLAMLAADIMARKMAKPKAYGNTRFILASFVCVLAIIATFTIAVIWAYHGMVNNAAFTQNSAIGLLCGGVAALSALSGFVAFKFFKRAEQKAYLDAHQTCSTAINEGLNLLNNDLSKPIQDNPLTSLAVACIAGAVVGKKL